MDRLIHVGMVDFRAGWQFQGVASNSASFKEFDIAVSIANAMMALAEEEGKNEFRIFVAPEYYFAGRVPDSKGYLTAASLPYAEKRAIIRAIEQTSSRYPRMLIIPGTIAYSKFAADGVEAHYNVCPIAYGGKIIHRYYKQCNDFIQSPHGFRPKSGPGRTPTFEVEGIRFGIEICLDHRYAVLKRYLPKDERVDIHLLISEGMWPMSQSVATYENNGLLIYCDKSGLERATPRILFSPPESYNGSFNVVSTQNELPVYSSSEHQLIDRLAIHGPGKPVISLFRNRVTYKRDENKNAA